MSITQSYIDEHLAGIHDWDSWGRAIFEQALNQARKKVGRTSAEIVELNAIVRILPVSGPDSSEWKFCIRVEVDFGNGPIGASWHTKSWHAAQG